MRRIIEKKSAWAVSTGFILLVFCSLSPVFAQDSTEVLSLLPERMGPMESFMWSEHGIMRKTGNFPLTQDGREKEMGLRRTFLSLHQLGGFATLACMTATVVLGWKTYNGADLGQLHRAMAWTTIGAYATTASLAVFTPPPLIRRKQWNTISTHKLLATLHLTGMVITPYLGWQVADGKRELAKIHMMSALATTALFGAAMLVVTF